jgi:hypothetical protein
MARFIQLTVALGFLLSISSSAIACPFCGSSTAGQVRAGIFNSEFGYHLGVALAPFSILIAVLILIYYWPASRPVTRRSNRSSSPVTLPTPQEQT